MIILHCLTESEWNRHKNNEYYGENYIVKGGFIHCSDIHNFHRVAPNFRHITEPMVLLCIDSAKVTPSVIWEDLYNEGEEYPHIYGALNLDAVTNVLPFLRDENGDLLLNFELQQILYKWIKNQKEMTKCTE